MFGTIGKSFSLHRDFYSPSLDERRMSCPGRKSLDELSPSQRETSNTVETQPRHVHASSNLLSVATGVVQSSKFSDVLEENVDLETEVKNSAFDFQENNCSGDIGNKNQELDYVNLVAKNPPSHTIITETRPELQTYLKKTDDEPFEIEEGKGFNDHTDASSLKSSSRSVVVEIPRSLGARKGETEDWIPLRRQTSIDVEMNVMKEDVPSPGSSTVDKHGSVQDSRRNSSSSVGAPNNGTSRAATSAVPIYLNINQQYTRPLNEKPETTNNSESNC